MSCLYCAGVISVTSGLTNSDFFSTTSFAMILVVVTLATGVALGVALRVLRFLGVVAFGVAGALAVAGMWYALRVYSHIIQKKGLTKTPL